jgi:hypothetical protein
MRPTIAASFSDYEPPFDARPIVRRMLDSVPEKYLLGLNEVVLTNTKSLSRTRRRSVTKSRKRKAKIAEAMGLYHPEWQGKPAWIEIFIDNTLKGWERGLWLKMPLIREFVIGDVLFHEIGHHIHFVIRPEFREKEDVADVWKVKLQRNYNRQRSHWLWRLFKFVHPLIAPLQRRLTMKMLKNGRISRAEYEESMTKLEPSRPR